MPSENEIVDQSGDTQPEPNTEAQPVEMTQPEAEQPETAVPENVPVEPEPEFAVEEGAEEEMDWDSWLSSSPEAEESLPVLEPAQELEAYLSNGEESSPDNEPDNESSDDEESNDNESDEESGEDSVEELADIVVAEVDEPVAEIVEVVAETAVEETFAQTDEIVEESVAIVVETAVIENPAEIEIVAELEEQLDEVPVPPPAKPKAPKKKHAHGLTTKDVIRYFAACTRCGYFLTGYRAAFGEDNFETAVSEEKDGWLTLSWGSNLPELIVKSYGTVVESNDLLFNNCCLECRRALLYNGLSEGEVPATFRVETKPKNR